MLVVMKFGGSVLRGTEDFKRASFIIEKTFSEGKKVVVVASALKGVTDKLITLSNHALKRNSNLKNKLIQELETQHTEVTEKGLTKKEIREEINNKLKTLINDLQKVASGIYFLGELTPRSKDYLMSFGERMSTLLLHGFLKEKGLKTKLFTGWEAGIITDSNFGEANPLINLTKYNVKRNLQPLLEKGEIPVVAGFIAATQEGEITTLGRGGSDFTATLLGCSLEADEIWLWTDVNGLMTADPAIVPSAKTIREISFLEATEMAVLGAKKMHPKALEPALKANIPVRIKNAFKPEEPGTLILKKRKIRRGEIVKAVTLIRNVGLINVKGPGMIGKPGTAAKIFNSLGRNKINILMISQSVSELNISMVIPEKDFEKALSTLQLNFLGEGLIQDVAGDKNICVVAVVGEGMKGTPGVAARVFKAVAQKGINVIMIAQGSSELNISFVIEEKMGEKAVKALHEEFSLGKIQ